MPNGALCEPWPGSVSSELAADAGAVAIRAFGEGVVPLRLPPHPLPPLAILQSRPASSVGSSDKFPHLWEVTVRCGSDTASGPARVLLSLDRSGTRSTAGVGPPSPAAFPCRLPRHLPLPALAGDGHTGEQVGLRGRDLRPQLGGIVRVIPHVAPAASDAAGRDAARQIVERRGSARDVDLVLTDVDLRRPE
jgi:hypothetical protein